MWLTSKSATNSFKNNLVYNSKHIKQIVYIKNYSTSLLSKNQWHSINQNWFNNTSMRNVTFKIIWDLYSDEHIDWPSTSKKYLKMTLWKGL